MIWSFDVFQYDEQGRKTRVRKVAIYGQIGGRIVTAIQFIIIPIVLLATVASAARDFIYPKSRVHSAAALALSAPVAFMYFVWRGWILP
jgi:hypothetical protein